MESRFLFFCQDPLTTAPVQMSPFILGSSSAFLFLLLSRTRNKNLSCPLSALPLGSSMSNAHTTRTIIPNAIGWGSARRREAATCLIMSVIILDIHSKAPADRNDQKNRTKIRNYQGIIPLIAPHNPNYMTMQCSRKLHIKLRIHPLSPPPSQ